MRNASDAGERQERRGRRGWIAAPIVLALAFGLTPTVAFAEDGDAPVASEELGGAEGGASGDSQEDAGQSSPGAEQQSGAPGADASARAAGPGMLSGSVPLSISLLQADGTPAWNWQDDSASNGIVRTNDLITYTAKLTANGTFSDPRVTFDLPKGTVLDEIPAFCQPGSSLDAPYSAFAAPVVPVTAASWQDLPQQTLVCVLNDLGPGGIDLAVDVTVKVRPEVPNGTVLTAGSSVSYQNDPAQSPVTLDSNAIDTTVAAQAQYDISKNGLVVPGNAGPVFNRQGSCETAELRDKGYTCQFLGFPVTISTVAEAKGNSPAQTITFTDDISPDAYFGPGTTANANWNPDYAPRLRNFGLHPASLVSSIPYGKIGAPASANPTNSVRDSGTMTTSPGKGGTGLIEVTIENADLSAFTYPSTTATGVSLPDQSRATVVAGFFEIEYPVEAISALGIPNASNDTWTVQQSNSYSAPELTDINGSSNHPDADDPANNTRSFQTVINRSAGVAKDFAGVIGAAGTQSWQDFAPSIWDEQSGLPGQSGWRSGDAPAVPGQTVISQLRFENRSSPVGDSTANIAACDVWDVDYMRLAPGDYDGDPTSRSQRQPSNGDAVWHSGTYGDGASGIREVQYGVVTGKPDPSAAGGFTPFMAGCDDSRIEWFPSIAAAGGIDNVGAVMVFMTLDRGTNDAKVDWVSIALQTTDDIGPVGTVLPNYRTLSVAYTPDGEQASLTEVLSSPIKARSDYVADQHVGVGYGDRLTTSDLFSSLNKQVREPSSDPASPVWVDEIQSFTGGQTADFRLIPSVSSANTAAVSDSVVIEDCLPAGLSIETSNRPYTTTVPADPGLSCAAGETYVRWDLGEVGVSDPLEPITYSASISKLQPAGTYRNTARITAAGDAAALDPEQFKRVTDAQNFKIQALRGVNIEKTAVTPQTQANLAGQAVNEHTVWEVRMGNLGYEGQENVDFIDVLPVTSGAGDTSFHGTMSLVSAEVTEPGESDPAGDQYRLYYATAPLASASPKHASNTNADLTPTAIWSETPPADLSQVTAVRYIRAGELKDTEVIALRITMAGVENRTGDAYRNSVEGIVHTTPSGPGGLIADSSASTVVASSVGNRVWFDLNRNGIQDSFQGSPEPGAAQIPVTLTGVDDLGNPVSLSAITNGSGAYSFPVLRASNADGYTVAFTAPSGTAHESTVFTEPRATGSTAENDSDADRATGAAAPVVIGVAEANTAIDAGLLPRGSVQLNKMLAGVGVQEFGSRDRFEFAVTCDLEGTAIDPATGEPYASDAPLDPATGQPLPFPLVLEANGLPAVTSQLPAPLPALAQCTFTETDRGNADDHAAPAQVLIPWDSDAQRSGLATASLTNRYSAGQIQLTKHLEGDSQLVEQVRDADFTFAIRCQVEETDAAGDTVIADAASGLWRIKGGETVILGVDDSTPLTLPLGARCFGEETGDLGATSSTISHDSYENAVEVVAGKTDELQQLSIVAVNVFECTDETCPTNGGGGEPGGRPGGSLLGIGALPLTGATLGATALLAVVLLAAAGCLLLMRRKRSGSIE